MTDAPWNGDQRRLQRRETSEHARKTAQFVIGSLPDEPEIDADTVASTLRNIRRVIIAAFEDISGSAKALLLLPALLIARARRSTSRAITATELSGAAAVGSVTAAAPIMLAIAITGSMIGSNPPVATAQFRSQSQSLAQSFGPSSPNQRITNAPVGRAAREYVRTWGARIESPSKRLPAAADNRIARDPRKIEIGRDIEVAGETYYMSRVTVECDESFIVTSTACTAYDEVSPGGR